MKTTNLLQVLALLTATLLTACASSAGPVGPSSTHPARIASRDVDRYYDPVSQSWLMTDK